MTQYLEQGNEVLVVGAGPVGFAMASELMRHGTPCRVVDASAAATPTSRALTIFPRTLEIFENMGVIEAILSAGHRLSSIGVYAAGRRLAHLSLGAIESPYPFVISLPQSETERILIAHLAQAGVNVERQVTLLGFTQEAQGVTARLRHLKGREETTRTPWLIGCDGARSTVRRTLGLPFAGTRYDETFVLADVTLHTSLPDDEVSLFFHQDGFLGLFPFGSGRYRVVAALPLEATELPPADLMLADVQALVDTRGPADSTISESLWLSIFHIFRRKVQHFRNGRVFLAGDAAHIHSPTSGQGMNTGIQDAYNLAWKLALVMDRHASQLLLDSYNVEREPVAHSILTLTDRITQLATLRNPVAQYIRDLILPILSGLASVQHRMVNTMAEVAVHYRHSPIVAQHWGGYMPGFHRAGPAAGDRASDGPLREATSGARKRLFEILRGTRHTLLLFGGLHPTTEGYGHLGDIGAEVLENYAEHIAVHIVIAGEEAPPELAWDGSVLCDYAHVVHQRYGAASSCLYLIRPDGYIGFCSLPAHVAYLRSYLRGQLFAGKREVMAR
jgi:2-polyprenyl-6-methoxyphenol hydroxylase-like FAD-dependent oxidoreductase